jgi:hypothetical protein
MSLRGLIGRSSLARTDTLAIRSMALTGLTVPLTSLGTLLDWATSRQPAAAWCFPVIHAAHRYHTGRFEGVGALWIPPLWQAWIKSKHPGQSPAKRREETEDFGMTRPAKRPRTLAEVQAAQDPAETARLDAGETFTDVHSTVSVIPDRHGNGDWRVEWFDDYAR